MVIHSVGSVCVALAPVPKVVRLVLHMAGEVVNLVFFAFSLFLAREAGIAFVQERCFFFEAMGVAFKRSFRLLPFVNAREPLSEKPHPMDSTEVPVNTLSSRTRFD